uniref:Uncharacterized protein n=1 Tax=viral metagenome TaxID=1070528 RepID=A0A6M3X5I8_9ZZZZ
MSEKDKTTRKILCPICEGGGSRWEMGVRGVGGYYSTCWTCKGKGEVQKEVDDNEYYYDRLKRRHQKGYKKSSAKEQEKKNKIVADAFDIPPVDYTTPQGRIALLTAIHESRYKDYFRRIIHEDKISILLLIGYKGQQDGGFSFDPRKDLLLDEVYQIIIDPPPWKESRSWKERNSVLVKNLRYY